MSVLTQYSVYDLCDKYYTATSDYWVSNDITVCTKETKTRPGEQQQRCEVLFNDKIMNDEINR